MSVVSNIKDYFVNRKARKLERTGRLVKNAKAIREDRWAAIEFLATDVDDANDAIPLLLQRFEYSLEHGINDTREKELALKGIVRFKEAGIPIVKSWLQSTQRIAWPIKVLKELGQDEVVVECLKSALNFGDDVAYSQHIVDKNYDILCYLRDYQLHESIEQVAHFLNDMDERVRYAAVELLVHQETDAVRVKLEKFLSDESAENRRLRGSIIQLFIAKNWRILDAEQFGKPLTESVRVSPEGYLVANA